MARPSRQSHAIELTSCQHTVMLFVCDFVCRGIDGNVTVNVTCSISGSSADKSMIVLFITYLRSTKTQSSKHKSTP